MSTIKTDNNEDLVLDTGTGNVGIEKLTITNEIRFEGHAGAKALIQKNASAGRDELQLYAAGDAYSTGSKGAGIHLYGNSDDQHKGNCAILTGPSGHGDGRLIVAGQEDNTTVVIGNGIFAHVDGHADYPDTFPTGMLTLKDPIGKPALFIQGAGGTEGDITWKHGESLQVGTWDGSTFQERMKINSSGVVTMPYQPTGTLYNPLDTNIVNNGVISWVDAGISKGGLTSSTTNNRFTVPVSGAYNVSVFISTTVISAYTNDGVHINIRKNGSIYLSSWAHTMANPGAAIGEEETFSNTMIVHCSANDYIDFTFSNLDSVAALRYGSANIHLIG